MNTEEKEIVHKILGYISVVALVVCFLTLMVTHTTMERGWPFWAVGLLNLGVLTAFLVGMFWGATREFKKQLGGGNKSDALNKKQ